MSPLDSPTSQPESSMIRVVAGVVRRGERVLICRRPFHKRHGGLWEFPGGKLRESEDFEGALRRELAEELDIELLRCGRVVFECVDPGSPFEIHFVEAEVVGEPQAKEHDAVEWVAIWDLADRPLAPADARFAHERFLFGERTAEGGAASSAGGES